MSISRRDFMRRSAASAAAAVAGVALPAGAQNVVTDAEAAQLKWSKAPCRFCGVGCGVMVAVKDGRVVATQGDQNSEVNRGINCVKGYFLSKIMYGKDRLTTPLLRMTDGKYDKNGEFTPITWDKAFDVMAAQWKRVLKEKGPTAVGMFGSGQWTIWEGYAAVKLMKAGFRSNNLDPNARHCMASAVTGFMRTFGMDEPMGCYDDIESADAFVLWGSNMAEMHPILWTRVTDRRLSAPKTRVAVLSVFEHRSNDLADLSLIFKPQTDLAILNFVANHIITTNRVNRDFVDKHVVFKIGNDDIGYGLRPEHPLQKAAKNAGDANGSKPGTFDEYARFVSRYDLDYTAKLTGVPKNRLVALAELYADPKTKVMSFWTMGFNQHTRGTWCNNLVYNLHLLTGKISTPGNSPFSLTGQPSACGTAREVGTFSHRLPADMLVANPKHRAEAEHIWKLPEGTIPDKPGYHAVLQNRMLKDGKLNAYWVQVNNNMQAAANLMEEGWPGYRNPDNFIVVSDVYPTVTALAADLILPAAMWVEKEGAYGNAERRTQFWHQMVDAPGDARSDLWQLVEFSKRFKIEEVWPAELLAKTPQYRGKTLYEVLFRNGEVDKFPLSGDRSAIRECRGESLRLLSAEGPVRGIRDVRARPRPRSRAIRRVPRGARPALARGRWQGDALAVSRRRRSLRQGRYRLLVLRQRRRQGRRLFAAVRAAGGIAGRRISVLAVDRPRARALAFRIHDAARARALSRVSERRVLHASRRRHRPRPASRHRGRDRFTPRQDAHSRGDARPRQAASRPRLRAVVRREPADQQGDARRDRSDFAADRLQEMRSEDRQGLGGSP